MSALTSQLDTRSAAFRDNVAQMQALVDDLKAKVRQIQQGGGDKAREKHLSRGKLLPRDRVRTLLDPGSPFLELSQFAAYDMYGGDITAAGVITGIGRVNGRECDDRLQ
jgi:3-methylcrotonyl-CoA carboxylase beta subunit